jgi:hypothetical protein
VTVLSGKITPTMDASLSLFGEYTKTNAKGEVTGISYVGVNPVGRSSYDFEVDSSIFVFGIGASLAFDLYGTPEPVSAPPAPAPVIEPKLEPMSQN